MRRCQWRHFLLKVMPVMAHCLWRADGLISLVLKPLPRNTLILLSNIASTLNISSRDVLFFTFSSGLWPRDYRNLQNRTGSSQRASHTPIHFTLLTLTSRLHLRLTHPLPFIYSSTPLYLQLPLSPDTLNCCPLRCSTLLASRSTVGKSFADQVAPQEVKNLEWRELSYNTVNTEDIQRETYYCNL